MERFEFMAENGNIIDAMDELNGERFADFYSVSKDTTAAEARRGKDLQGFSWAHISSREEYRRLRLEKYRSYENVPSSCKSTDKEFKTVPQGGKYYEFFHNTRFVKPTVPHFQLRNLVWATSKHDVYLLSNNSVKHWSSVLRSLTEVLNFSGHVSPAEKYPGSLLEGFTDAQISTLAVSDRFLVAGGCQGELICKCLDKPGVSFCTMVTLADNAITNAIEIFDSLSGELHFMVSSNDSGLREYDLEKFQLVNHFRFPWPVNHISVSPNRTVLLVVGDDTNGSLVDARNGKTVASIVGHLDYSFASAWHPEGRVIATGNQDKTCRLWDLRNLTQPMKVLKGRMGAARSVRFSSDGQFLVVAEAADFVHMYSTMEDYKKRQEIDLFGRIAGVSLSPDDESLYIGLCDITYGSLLQYNRRHKFDYLDSYV